MVSNSKCSEAVIAGQVDNVLVPGREGMLEPSDSVSDRCDIMIAWVVCKGTGWITCQSD